MSSFRSGLRGAGYRFQTENVDGTADTEIGGGSVRNSDCGRRGNSLPTNYKSVNVQILPNLRQSLTDPEIAANFFPENVIETDYVRPSESSSSSSPMPDGPTGTHQHSSRTETDDFETYSETCRELRKTLLEGLDNRIIPGRRTTGGNYNLLLNTDLLDRVSLDIVRMSQLEPSGLNGCRLRTRVERQHSADMDLGCLRVNKDTEETFEIVLSLKECQKIPSERRRSLRNVSSLLSTIFKARRSQVGPVRVYVGDAYQLEKIKLRKYSDRLSQVMSCES